MKKILQWSFAVGMLPLLLAACAGNKKLQKGALRGNWMVSSVHVEGVNSGTRIKTTAFDDAAVECFNGSQWQLPNNGFGTYTISEAGCLTGERRIIWSVRTANGINYFNFKKMDGVRNSRANEVEEGYSMEITSLSGNAFTARSPVNFEGRTIYIIYDFVKQ